MIEVLFGESEAGAMKIALKSGRLGSDAVCLAFALEIGDIKKPVTGEYRARLLCELLYAEQWGADVEMKNELERLGSVYRGELNKLESYIKSGEPIRVWYDNAPYSVCGLLWLCWQFRGLANELEMYVVKLPRTLTRGETAVVRTNWGEAHPREFVKLLPLQRRLKPVEVVMNAVNWDGLRSQNAPLRAVVNGSVMSVPAGFYDFLIWKNLGGEPIREAALIGRILDEDHIGVGDWWYARRIDKLISQNRIKVVQNSPRKYERLLVKNERRKSAETAFKTRRFFAR